LAFVANFVASDVQSLSDQDLDALRRRLSTFVGEDSAFKAFYSPGRPGNFPNTRRLLEWLRSPGSPRGFVVDLPDGKTALEISRRDLSNLQGIVSELLVGWADFRDAVEDESGRIVPKDVREFGLKNLRFFMLPGRTVVTTRDVEGAFAFALSTLLGSESASRLRRCPECQSFFVRVGRQEYCNRRCVNRVNMRAWRMTPKGRKSARRRSRARYERKQRAIHPNAKIGTNAKRGTRED
jgi:hypothetical protein